MWTKLLILSSFGARRRRFYYGSVECLVRVPLPEEIEDVATDSLM